jgi:hypothetical protein
VPEKISIGSGVCAELGLQVKHITYNVEQYCTTEKNNYEAALLAYNVAALGLEEIDKTLVERQLEGYWLNGEWYPPVPDAYFGWEDGIFQPLTKEMILGEGGYYERESAIIYHPTAVHNLVSQLNIDILYQDLINAEKIFINAIDILLKA